MNKKTSREILQVEKIIIDGFKTGDKYYNICIIGQRSEKNYKVIIGDMITAVLTSDIDNQNSKKNLEKIFYYINLNQELKNTNIIQKRKVKI